MGPWIRRWVYVAFGMLWLTGGAWLLLHFFFQRETDFGTQSHPLQPKLLAVHGVFALLAVFLFGWIAAAHIGSHWSRNLNRITGVVLVVLVSVLALTGLANYYLVDPDLRGPVSVAHEILGAIAIVPALVHWLFPKQPSVVA